MESEIQKLIEEDLLKENIKIDHITFGEEDGEKTLFIVIDSEGGVDSDLCVKAMKIVNPLLDKSNINLDDYVIDVCSKGVEE